MYMIAIKNINNTLVHRVCEIEFVRYYLFSLSVESPLSTVKPRKQIKRNAHVSLFKQRDIHKDHIVNISGFYQL